MNDYKYIYSKRLQHRERNRALALVVVLVACMGFIGPYKHENEIVKAVAKSRTQEKIEKILPEPVAEAIVKHTDYPRTMAAIAHTESRGCKNAVGDGGDSKGLFQVQPKHWSDEFGPVPDELEAQVQQANKIFIALVNRYGYREAVKRWNGSGTQASRYQKIVLAKVRTLE